MVDGTYMYIYTYALFVKAFGIYNKAMLNYTHIVIINKAW